MHHSQKKEIRDTVDMLLQQYKEYTEATTEAEKKRIGDEMFYSDPVVWMMYKHEAYIGSDHEINTLGDLKEHSNGHGDICAKRFEFLSSYIQDKYLKNIRDTQEFPDETPMQEFYTSEIVNAVVSDEDFMRRWKENEYYKKDGVVAKWQA